MKKFYISLFLFVVSAFCVNIDARWDIGDIKAPSEIQAGDTVAIEYCASSARIGRYLAGGFIAPLGIIDENCAWVVEDGPADMRTGAPTFYFRQVSTNLYIGTNGSTFGNEAFNMAEDQMSAANFQIISYGEPIPWANRKPTWRTNEPWEWTEDYKQGDREKFDWEVQGSSQATKEYSVAFTFSSGSNIDDFKYLANWSNDNVAYWQYCSTIEWNVYDISYVHDKMADLANLIAQYESFQPLAGDVPGLYAEDAVNYYTEVLITAYMIANTPGLSDEEYDKAMADLTAAKEACEASQVPITDGGYYYIVSGYADYLAEQGSENALYPRDGFVGYSNFTGHEIDPKFVWKFTKADDYQDWQGWNIQSLLSEQYIGRQSSDYGVQRPMVDENDNPQYLKIQADALWFITDRTSGTKVSLQCGVAAGKVDAANDKEGKCWGYWVYGENPMTYPDAKNLWYIRPVPAEVMAQIEDAKKQSLRNEELKNLANSAKDIYEKLFVLNAPMKEKLIVNADEETGQITCNAGRTEGTKFVNLIDSDSLTYLHTDGGYTLAPHHFQFDISDNPQSAVTFVYDRRRGAFDDPKLSSITGWGIDESPAYVSIYVTNDTTNGGEWKQIVNNLGNDI